MNRGVVVVCVLLEEEEEGGGGGGGAYLFDFMIFLIKSVICSSDESS